MARLTKSSINTPFLHIMIQGNNKRYIFENNEDKDKYLKILKEVLKEIDVIILSYCIMGNHTHLLFYEANIERVIKFMQKTNMLYAKYYNNKYNRVGYVFRDRYKLQPILSERHLITCIDYIHKNPVKAGICQNPSNYYYSSFNRNIFERNGQLEKNVRRYIDEKKALYKEEIRSEFVLLEDESDKEDKEIIAQRMIEMFLMQKKMELDDLKNDTQLLIKVVKRLKEKYNISLRTSSKVLNIGRDKLRNMILKSNK